MTIEVMKQALEALESYGKSPYIKQSHPKRWANGNKSITSLRQAIAEAEKQKHKCNPHPKAPHGFNRNASHANDRYTCECESWDAYDAGYQAGLIKGFEEEGEEENQEPVGITDDDGNAWMYGYLGPKFPPNTLLYTHAQRTQPDAEKQEPVAHCVVRPLQGNESTPQTRIEWKNGKPVAGLLYTSPQQRQWVGLTLEQKQRLNDALNLQGRFPVIDAIEAEVKRNNT